MSTLPIVVLVVLCTVFTFDAKAKDGYQHFPGVFLGATHADSETDFTYTLEYEYKFSQHFGVGLVYEKINDAHHGDGITIKLASIYYHFGHDFRLGLGYGEEKIGGYHPHTENVTRVNLSYEYHFEHFSLAPSLSIDFIDGENATVFGLAFIKPF